MASPKNGSTDPVGPALRELLRAGLELGVAEAARRVSQMVPPGSDRALALDVDRVVDLERLREFAEAIRADPTGALQLVKEVWGRGDAKERRIAAHALGHGLARLAPHRALGLTRELASMAGDPKEADLVGQEAIAPMLDSNPPFYDRVKQFLQDDHPWLRRAAVAGLVHHATRNRKMTGVVLDAVLLLAERHEPEIRSAVKAAVRELSATDWKASGKALVEWARNDPTGGRTKVAKQLVASAAAGAKQELQKFVFTQLGRIAVPVVRAR